MKIAWTMDQVLRCGGIRVVFEHCRQLTKLGHKTAIYANNVDNGVKEWKERYMVNTVNLSKLLDDDVDVIISVWWRQLDQLLQCPAKRRFHFVQGRDILSYPIGHDFIPQLDQAMHRTDYDYLAVSEWAGESCRDPKIVPNGVDTQFFRPGLFTKIFPTFRILLEGSTTDKIKGIAESLEVARLMKAKYSNVECWCISQDFTSKEFNNDIIDRKIIGDNDMDILNAYQNANVLLKMTWCDGFGLPHLEAMACGLPVVTTNAGGNMTFCRDNYNCLVSDPKNVYQAFDNIERVYLDQRLRNQLIGAGLETAQRFNWEQSTSKLLEAIK